MNAGILNFDIHELSLIMFSLRFPIFTTMLFSFYIPYVMLLFFVASSVFLRPQAP